MTKIKSRPGLSRGEPLPVRFKAQRRLGIYSVLCSDPSRACSGWLGYALKIRVRLEVGEGRVLWEREEPVVRLRPDFAQRIREDVITERGNRGVATYMAVSKRAARRLEANKVWRAKGTEGLRYFDALNDVLGDEDEVLAQWRAYRDASDVLAACASARNQVEGREPTLWYEFAESNLPLDILCPECGRLAKIKTLAGIFP